MIRALVEQTFDSTKKYYVLYGLSTDTKPTSGLITGSEFHEVDTGVKYEFDEVSSEWHVAGITSDEIKDEIDAWLDDHPEATTTVLDGAISYAKLDSSLKGTVDDVGDLNTEIQTKANVDGSYSSLTAGNAEQLVSTVGVEDKTPYLFRTTGGSADVGDRVKLSEITGGTVAWNQLVKNGNFMDSTLGWIPENPYYASVSASDGVLTVTATQTPTYFYNLGIKNNQMTPIVGHKYLFHAEVNSPVGNLDFGMRSVAFYTGTMVVILTSVTDQWTSGYKIINCNGTGAETTPYFAPSGITGFENGSVIKWRNIFIIDLTAMFGSTIADYIYGLESGTAGAGVAWFRKLFPKDYYAYDAGSLLSVKTSAHKEYGFNAYDNTTGKAKVVGGQVYQITGTYTALSLDGTSITPDASGYFTPAASGEITVTGGNATDTCIHLKWDGERDGEYEPYEEHFYALDDVELRGIPKLDASNNLYYDGDSYAPDGTVTRRYGIVDLGTLNWQYVQTGGTNERFQSNISGIATITNSDLKANAVCDKYVTSAWGNLDRSGYDKFFCRAAVGDVVAIRDISYSDAASFKAAMSGVMLVYELATPTTESADPYQETQVCNDFGTEEFVDSRTVPMPVGANALYQANLRAKLEMAPDSPDGDGDYLVRQTDGLNEYVAVSSNSTISGLSTRCPACPTDTDGNFVLKAVVSSGSVTYSWVAEA